MSLPNPPSKTRLFGPEPAQPAQPPARRTRAEIRATAAERKSAKKDAAYDWIPQEPTELETLWRHGHWKNKRAKVREALARNGVSPMAQERFRTCGADCMVEVSATENRHRIRGQYCHNRHCEPCMRAKANLIIANLKRRLATTPNGRYRFITLTLQHTIATELAPQLKRLYASFKKLRSDPCWKTQRGGAFMLEVKHSDTGWHPHLHIVAEGDYLPISRLQNAWHRVTGDSFQADIRAIDNDQDAAAYVGKYVTKGATGDTWLYEHTADEYICAMKGVRTCQSFGNWRSCRMTAHLPGATDWTPVARLDTLYTRARAGDLSASNLILILRPPGATDARQAEDA